MSIQLILQQMVETGTNDGILELKETVTNMNQRLTNVEATVNGFDNRVQNVEKIIKNLLKLSKKEGCEDYRYKTIE